MGNSLYVHSLFKQAIKDNNLVTPADSNAFLYYDYIASNFEDHRILESMTEALYITIMDRSQKVLNYTLDISEGHQGFKSEEMKIMLDALDRLLLIHQKEDPLYSKIFVRRIFIDLFNHFALHLEKIAPFLGIFRG